MLSPPHYSLSLHLFFCISISLISRSLTSICPLPCHVLAFVSIPFCLDLEFCSRLRSRFRIDLVFVLDFVFAFIPISISFHFNFNFDFDFIHFNALSILFQFHSFQFNFNSISISFQFQFHFNFNFNFNFFHSVSDSLHSFPFDYFDFDCIPFCSRFRSRATLVPVHLLLLRTFITGNFEDAVTSSLA